MNDKMRDDSTQHELVSVLADGEADHAESLRALDWLQDSAEARARWHAMHVIRDVLGRRELAADAGGDVQFLARLHARLQDEEVPRSLATASTPRREAANEGRFWKRLATAAAVCGLAVLSWQMLGAEDAPGAAVLARSTLESAPVAAVDAPVMLRDPRLDQLLMAHQQSAGASALQKPAGFMRNATFERDAR